MKLQIDLSNNKQTNSDEYCRQKYENNIDVGFFPLNIEIGSIPNGQTCLPNLKFEQNTNTTNNITAYGIKLDIPIEDSKIQLAKKFIETKIREYFEEEKEALLTLVPSYLNQANDYTPKFYDIQAGSGLIENIFGGTFITQEEFYELFGTKNLDDLEKFTNFLNSVIIEKRLRDKSINND